MLHVQTSAILQACLVLPPLLVAREFHPENLFEVEHNGCIPEEFTLMEVALYLTLATNGICHQIQAANERHHLITWGCRLICQQLD